MLQKTQQCLPRNIQRIHYYSLSLNDSPLQETPRDLRVPAGELYKPRAADAGLKSAK